MDLVERLRTIMGVKKRTFKDGGNVIEITESESEKTMRFNNIVYSRINRNVYTHQYWDFFVPIASLYENPRILMIGLGAGTVPYQLVRLMEGGYSIDVVEISKPIIDEYNSSEQSNDAHVRIFQGDGADYVHNNRDAYDVIILDAFVDANIPAQFFTEDFIANANACLKQDGILAINYLNPANGATNVEEYRAKLGRFFKIYEIRISGVALNHILLCSKRMGKEEMVSLIRGKISETRENAFILREIEQMQ